MYEKTVLWLWKELSRKIRRKFPGVHKALGIVFVPISQVGKT